MPFIHRNIGTFHLHISSDLHVNKKIMLHNVTFSVFPNLVCFEVTDSNVRSGKPNKYYVMTVTEMKPERQFYAIDASINIILCTYMYISLTNRSLIQPHQHTKLQW